ncbi:hypothetical protein LTR37_010884 [Vermiconidia calcicola]|uniref:Uncharacterized protein n=1 Tax=Vermiconidia calcicola TaxID=1690605 RepID=A0ACC3N3Y6_9PEZI|nr:hypothetical protein LTR37_010884 [Vermiconidia calcicola]
MYNPNSIATPPESPGQEKSTSTAAKLERLSAAVVNAHNARDFSFQSEEAQELVAHLTHDWEGQFDTHSDQTHSYTWNEQVSAWKERAENYPRVHFQIVQTSSNVSEKYGWARVYMDMEVSGIGELTLHAMNELRWKRVDGKWWLYYVLGMRGTPMNAGLP